MIIHYFNDVVHITSQAIVFNLTQGYIIELNGQDITIGIIPVQKSCIPSSTNDDRPLYQDCIEALNAIVPHYKVSIAIGKLFHNMYPLSKNSGWIDWDKIDHKINIGYNYKFIITALETLFNGPFDKSLYIVWRDSGPTMKTTLDDFLSGINELFYLPDHKFIFNSSTGSIIEITGNGEITVGIVPLYLRKRGVMLTLLSQLLERKPLYKKCIDKLKATILFEDSNQRIKFFEQAYPTTPARVINWENIDQKCFISDPKLIIPTLQTWLTTHFDKDVYVYFVGTEFPILKTNIYATTTYLHNMIQVSLPLIIFNPTLAYVIEVTKDDTITCGLFTQGDLQIKKAFNSIKHGLCYQQDCLILHY